MNNRKLTIKRIPTTKPNHFVDVYVAYNKGGTSFSTYKQIPRGYSLHVQPIKVEENNGIVCTSFMGFSGLRQHVKDANRFSKKQLELVAKECESNDIMQYMIDCVCEKQSITLKEEVSV